ncbi:MAG: ABC transporter permease, partial [Bacteroidota bacterium]
MGVLGSVVGALLGSALQVLLPVVLSDFLPIENVSREVSGLAIAEGIITGLGIALLFALLPLLAIRKTSPLRTLRASYEEDNQQRDYWRWLIYVLIFLFIAGFTWLQTRSGVESLIFPVGIFISFLLLAGVARLLMWLVRRFFPVSWSYVWRQGVANLYRPNNQTLILIVSIGLGTALISTLFFTQNLLLSQVELTGSGDQPNMILFDIQSSQKEGVAELAVENDLPLIQQVPIVTMRLDQIDGIDKMQNEADTTSKRREWVYNREYRVTYRDTLIDTETIVDGTWHGELPDDGKIYVSVADNVARSMNAEIGTKVTFNVQGAMIETEISSIREVNFN